MELPEFTYAMRMLRMGQSGYMARICRHVAMIDEMRWQEGDTEALQAWHLKMIEREEWEAEERYTDLATD